MADDRTYIRVHDGMPGHPKVRGLSDKAFRTMVSAWCYCSEYLTDGEIVTDVARWLGTNKTWAELVAKGIAESAPNGYLMHDYLEHQRSAEEVAAFKAKKKSAGAKGNHTKHHVERGRIDPECGFCQSPDGSQTASQVRPQTARKAVASTEAATEAEEENSVRGGSHVSSDPSNDAPPLYPDQCAAHANDPMPGNCGLCKEQRIANAAKPRHLAAVGLMSRCIVHDQSYTSVCSGCRADGLAYDKEVS